MLTPFDSLEEAEILLDAINGSRYDEEDGDGDERVIPQSEYHGGAIRPVRVPLGIDHAPPNDNLDGITFQRCGGGRRVLRKRV